MKHTPGPWKWWTSNSWKRLKRDSENCEQVLSPYNAISDGHPDIEISEADMLLIAAAPELLEALKLVLKDKAPSYHDCVDDGEPECAWCISTKAIAKAEGQ